MSDVQDLSVDDLRLALQRKLGLVDENDLPKLDRANLLKPEAVEDGDRCDAFQPRTGEEVGTCETDGHYLCDYCGLMSEATRRWRARDGDYDDERD